VLQVAIKIAIMQFLFSCKLLLFIKVYHIWKSTAIKNRLTAAFLF